MNLFRLTYFVGTMDCENKWECHNRYEIFGSAQAILDIYFHLKQLQKIRCEERDNYNCPIFIQIKDKDGQIITEDEILRQGIYAFASDNTFE